MVLDFEEYVDEDSRRIIYNIFSIYAGSATTELVKQIIMAAQETHEKKGSVFVTNGIHTNYEFVKGAEQNKTYTAFWFDVIVKVNGRVIGARPGRSKLHLYVAKYYLLNDFYGKLYYERNNIETSPELGYSPKYVAYNPRFIEYWFLTGTVTDGHEQDKEIMMVGGNPEDESEDESEDEWISPAERNASDESIITRQGRLPSRIANVTRLPVEYPRFFIGENQDDEKDGVEDLDVEEQKEVDEETRRSEIRERTERNMAKHRARETGEDRNTLESLLRARADQERELIFEYSNGGRPIVPFEYIPIDEHADELYENAEDYSGDERDERLDELKEYDPTFSLYLQRYGKGHENYLKSLIWAQTNVFNVDPVELKQIFLNRGVDDIDDFIEEILAQLDEENYGDDDDESSEIPFSQPMMDSIISVDHSPQRENAEDLTRSRSARAAEERDIIFAIARGNGPEREMMFDSPRRTRGASLSDYDYLLSLITAQVEVFNMEPEELRELYREGGIDDIGDFLRQIGDEFDADGNYIRDDDDESSELPVNSAVASRIIDVSQNRYRPSLEEEARLQNASPFLNNQFVDASDEKEDSDSTSIYDRVSRRLQRGGNADPVPSIDEMFDMDESELLGNRFIDKRIEKELQKQGI